MFKNRKGLSEIVMTVLILLIVVALVSALVIFVKPMISSSGSGLNKAQYCTSTVFEPVSCEYSSKNPNNKLNVYVTVRRGSTPAEPDTATLVFTLLNNQVIEKQFYTGTYPTADGVLTKGAYTDDTPNGGFKAVQVKVVYTDPNTQEKITCMSNRILCS